VINESLSVLRGGNKSSMSPNSKDNFIRPNSNLGKLETSELKQSIKVSEQFLKQVSQVQKRGAELSRNMDDDELVPKDRSTLKSSATP
jgi:hypothetical protein